jgi:mitogen-activated protein kinase organizer 1
MPQLINTISNAHQGLIHALCYDKSGKYILSGAQDRTIYLWNASSGLKIQSFSFHSQEILDLSITSDSTRFASAGGDRNVCLWDVTSGKILARHSGHLSRINSVAFNTDGSVLASASYDKNVKLWDTKSRSHRPIQTLDEAKDSVSSVVIKDNEIFTGSVDGTLRIYDVRYGKLSNLLLFHPITSVWPSTDSCTVLASCLDSVVRLMDKSTGTLLQAFKSHANAQFRIKSFFLNNEEWVVSPSEDGKIYLWDVVKGNVLHKFGSAGTAYSISVHPDDRQIATSTLGGSIEFWSL